MNVCSKRVQRQNYRFYQQINNGFLGYRCIGIAEKYQSDVTYKKLNENNISRNDLLGEF